MTSVKLVAEDQPVAIHFAGDEGKPYKPCKSMRRVLVRAWGADGAQYVGKSMTLFLDEQVRFGGAAVGGIRISHLSHIEKSITMALTATRATKKAYTVQVLATPASAPEASTDKYEDLVRAGDAASSDGVKMYSAWLANLTPEQRTPSSSITANGPSPQSRLTRPWRRREIDHELERVVLHRAPWARRRNPVSAGRHSGTRILGRRDVGYGDKKHDLDEVHAVRRTWWKARTVFDQRDASRSIRRSQSARVAGPGRRKTIHAGSARRQGRDDRQSATTPARDRSRRNEIQQSRKPKVLTMMTSLSEEMTVTTELTVVQRAAIALQSETAAAHLIALAASTKDMAAPTNRAGRDQCHAAAMAALKARTAVVNAAKEARADATAFSKAVIAEEARLVALIEPEEIRLKSLRDAYDAEQERIKREAAQREKGARTQLPSASIKCAMHRSPRP